MSNQYEICGDPARRHDFLLLFDVTDGNPNGDPDAGNMPRVDPETMQGLVTDVCLKRKVRNYVELYAANGGDRDGLSIYIQDKGIALNALHRRAYEAEGLTSTGSHQARAAVDRARERMAKTYYDVRMFGAVMTTEVNCGQVRGPVQMTFARSIDPIAPLDCSITRVAITRERDTEVVVAEGEEEGRGGKRTEMGSKPFLPYGLYLNKGYFSPSFASQTGVSREDLELFWTALANMWDQDRSSSRGAMACRGLFVFSHENGLGNAPAQALFDMVRIQPLGDGCAPRSFSDYAARITLPKQEQMPTGVTFTRLVG